MQSVSEWLADTLTARGIRTNFTVPGGGAMYMNVAFGHHPDMENIFVQHEQAAAIAAEGYWRVHNELPLVCCTTGPGGTNTLTGVLGAWLDSIPMLVISGQVRFDCTARYEGLPVRAVGDQEFDITKTVSSMTKYAVMVTEPEKIRYHLEKALFLAEHGRPGPVWLDIPQNVQRALIDPETIPGFAPSECAEEVPAPLTDEILLSVIEKIRSAKRPVFNAGNGIRIAGAADIFRKTVSLLKIPVVTGWDSIDLIPDDDPYYTGRAGLMGDRAGNFAVQNADLLLSVGSRLSIRQVGYNKNSWAREAFVIMVDIDEAEMKKHTIHVELPLRADAKVFLKSLNRLIPEGLPEKTDWVSMTQDWKRRYPVVLPKHYEEKEYANVYCLIGELSKKLPEGQVTVTGNGSACVVGSHAFRIKNGSRFLINSGAASMGYDLPAAVGACLANGRKKTVCLSGDGSIQMNLQELQTIVFHKLPIPVFVINNQGYHSMRQTQHNLFPEYKTVGVGPESRDLSFPDMEKIAYAYGIPYYAIRKNSETDPVLQQVLSEEGPVLCEIFVDTEQVFEPKSATKKLPDGRLVSPPLEDLAPFLPREELEQIMQIPLWPEE